MTIHSSMDLVPVFLWMIVLDLVCMVSVSVAQWSYYGAMGPSMWSELWPYCCAGNKQSPIDINPFHAQDLNTSSISFHGYGSDDIPHGAKMEFVNNGKTVEIQLTGDYFIKNGPLDATYQAVKVNFHWGKTDDTGSEHSILGRTFAGEIQIVHYDKDHLRSYDEALEYQNGLVVLSIFIEVSTKPNPAFEKVSSVVDKVRFKGKNYVLPRVFPLGGILPSKTDRGDFFLYEGSLTNPNCNEVVQWVVFRNPMTVSRQQLAMFRQLHTSGLFGLGLTNRTLVNNFRPTQPINKRTIYHARIHNAATNIKYSYCLHFYTSIVLTVLYL